MADAFPLVPPQVTADGADTTLLSVQGGFNQLTYAVRTALNSLAGGSGVTFPLLAPDGTAAAPSYSFAGLPTLGLIRFGGSLVLVSGGAFQISFGNTSAGDMSFGSLGVLRWSSSTDPSAGADTAFSRLSAGFLALGNGTIKDFSGSLKLTKLYADYTNTGTVGAVTINKASGRVNIAAAGTSVVVTNSFCTAAAHVFANVSTADNTAKSAQVTPAAGSFTVTLNAAATGQVAIDFFIVNAD